MNPKLKAQLSRTEMLARDLKDLLDSYAQVVKQLDRRLPRKAAKGTVRGA